MRTAIICLILWLAATAGVYSQRIELLQQGRNCSLRGLSVVNNDVAWVSGSKGTVAITIDGAKTWSWLQVKGFEQSDFRDIEAFSAKEAIIMSSGTPAVIMKTTDGGASWQTVFRSDDKAYFLDAMDFMPDGKHGFTLGDPIDGKFLLLETLDEGSTWAKFKYLPDALPGEAAFAASGTCIRVDSNQIDIVTGGSNARMLTYSIRYSDWYEAQILLLKQGKPSQGAFSIANGKKSSVIVGGDYEKNFAVDSVAQYWTYNGNYFGWLIYSPKIPPTGYQSCVEYINNNNSFLSTGTPGSNLTNDGGQIWKQVDATSFNVCRKAKSGNLVLLAGDQGRIGIFKN